MIIEIQSEAELEKLVKVLRESFGTVAREFGITEQNAPTNPAFIDLDKLKEYAAGPARLFGLFEGEKAIGCVAIEKAKDDDTLFYIERLAVLPEGRHRGYGASLVAHAEGEIRKAGGVAVSIGIVNENKVLKDWYCKLGFIETGRKRFPHLPFEVCFMKKELPAQC